MRKLSTALLAGALLTLAIPASAVAARQRPGAGFEDLYQRGPEAGPDAVGDRQGRLGGDQGSRES